MRRKLRRFSLSDRKTIIGLFDPTKTNEENAAILTTFGFPFTRVTFSNYITRHKFIRTSEQRLALKKAQSKIHGYQRKFDLTGQVFNGWKIVAYDDVQNNWLMECEITGCNQTRKRTTGIIQKEQYKSCIKHREKTKKPKSKK